MPETLPAAPGTYILFLHLDQIQTISVGRLGDFSLLGSIYAYVGSARGPGGLRARIGRHLRQDKTRRWHIDTLTATAAVNAIWYDTSTIRLECTWAHRLVAVAGISQPIPRFGSSDCACLTHLFSIPASLVGQVWQALDQPHVFEPK